MFNIFKKKRKYLEENWSGKKVYINDECIGYVINWSRKAYQSETFQRIELKLVTDKKEYKKQCKKSINLQM